MTDYYSFCSVVSHPSPRNAQNPEAKSSAFPFVHRALVASPHRRGLWHGAPTICNPALRPASSRQHAVSSPRVQRKTSQREASPRLNQRPRPPHTQPIHYTEAKRLFYQLTIHLPRLVHTAHSPAGHAIFGMCRRASLDPLIGLVSGSFTAFLGRRPALHGLQRERQVPLP